MPDLTTIYTRTCPTVEDWQLKFVSESSGNEYTLSWSSHSGWACSCPGFNYRGHCSHVDDPTLREQWCGWGQDAYAGAIHDEKTCPQCGRETKVIAVAV